MLKHYSCVHSQPCACLGPLAPKSHLVNLSQRLILEVTTNSFPGSQKPVENDHTKKLEIHIQDHKL